MSLTLIRSSKSSLLLLLMMLIANQSSIEVFAQTSSLPSTTGNSGISVVQNAEDQFRLGRSYERGEGVKQSYAIAGEWYLKAADQGNLKAMHNLGVLFLEGLGTPKDAAQGYHWIRKAAENGDAGSAYIAGLLLINGEGTKKNPTEGVLWLRKAANAGNPDALARLGQDTYFGDDGIHKDLKSAIPLIKSAAVNGNPWACDTLGLLYEKGEGVPKDPDLANEWLSKGSHSAPVIH